MIYYSCYVDERDPEIKELYCENDRVFIKTSSAQSIRLLSDNRYTCLKRADEGEELYDADFNISPVNNYFRIEVIDCNGKKAYTNAYFLEDFRY